MSKNNFQLILSPCLDSRTQDQWPAGGVEMEIWVMCEYNGGRSCFLSSSFMRESYVLMNRMWHGAEHEWVAVCNKHMFSVELLHIVGGWAINYLEAVLAVIFRLPGLRISLSRILTICSNLGRLFLSFCQQSSISWYKGAGQSIGGGRR